MSEVTNQPSNLQQPSSIIRTLERLMRVKLHHTRHYPMRQLSLLGTLIGGYWLVWTIVLVIFPRTAAILSGLLIMPVAGFLGDRILRSGWSIPVVTLALPMPVVIPLILELIHDYSEQNRLSVVAIVGGVFVVVYFAFWWIVGFGVPAAVGAGVSQGLRRRRS